MLRLVIIKHKNITRQNLLDAIHVKQVAWPYPLDAQETWISKNIQNDDFHCFLKEGNKTVAYMNLVDEEVILDAIPYKIWGIGNVCSAIKGKRYGNILMRMVNNYIIDNNRIGLLFCRKPLIPFYQRNNWMVVKEVNYPKLPDDIYVMIFNDNIEYHNFMYKGRDF